ncbi:hypothetical protein CHUAL_001509 [Chamberlinius hualienensis]
MVIIPPADVDLLTDEEDIDDCNLEEKAFLPNDVPGEIEVQWCDSDSDEENIPLSVLKNQLYKGLILSSRNIEPRTKKQKLPIPKWTKKNLNISKYFTFRSHKIGTRVAEFCGSF